MAYSFSIEMVNYRLVSYATFLWFQKPTELVHYLQKIETNRSIQTVTPDQILGITPICPKRKGGSGILLGSAHYYYYSLVGGALLNILYIPLFRQAQIF